MGVSILGASLPGGNGWEEDESTKGLQVPVADALSWPLSQELKDPRGGPGGEITTGLSASICAVRRQHL